MFNPNDAINEDLRKNPLRAFHGDLKIKEQYIQHIRGHREPNNLIKGKDELGIPEWLAHVEEIIFEKLTDDEAKVWPEQFLSAINPGSDLNKIKKPFIIFILESNLANFDHEKFPEVKKCIDECIRLYSEDITTLSAARSALFDARSAESSARYVESAESAAWSALSAARSVAWSAALSANSCSTWSSSWAVEAAVRSVAYCIESAAKSAAWAVESAARSAAWYIDDSIIWSAALSAIYKKFADKLIELIIEEVGDKNASFP